MISPEVELHFWRFRLGSVHLRSETVGVQPVGEGKHLAADCNRATSARLHVAEAPGQPIALTGTLDPDSWPHPVAHNQLVDLGFAVVGDNESHLERLVVLEVGRRRQVLDLDAVGGRGCAFCSSVQQQGNAACEDSHAEQSNE